MAGGVTGVSAGNRTSYDPNPRSFIYFHGQGISTRLHVIRLWFSVSRTDTDSSDSIIWKRGRHVRLHKNPPPAEDYNVLSGRTKVRMRWQKTVPAEDYNVLSGVTRSNQKSHKELQRPVGTWSQNTAAGTFGHLQVHTHDASDETCHFRIRNLLQPD